MAGGNDVVFENNSVVNTDGGASAIQQMAPVRSDIGWARVMLGAGLKVRRSGWNGKGMAIELQTPDAHSKMTQPYVFLNTADGGRIPWNCSQADLLANDWELAE